ncbi:unnamed protein product [Closterium sp. NIES-53]
MLFILSRMAVTTYVALLSFTLDSGASQCFFRNHTTITPLLAPVPVALADPSSGPVVACSLTTLPCSAVPSGFLIGLYIPLTAICTDASTGALLATFTREPHSGLFVLHPTSSQVAESGQVAASCSCRSLAHPTVLGHHCLGHPSIPRLCSMASHSLVSGLQGVFPSLPPSLAPPCTPCATEGTRGTRVRCLHSDRGGKFRSGVLAGFCSEQGIRQSWTLLESPQQNGVAEHRIGLVMDIARTSMIHARAPHFPWP